MINQYTTLQQLEQERKQLGIKHLGVALHPRWINVDVILDDGEHFTAYGYTDLVDALADVFTRAQEHREGDHGLR